MCLSAQTPTVRKGICSRGFGSSLENFLIACDSTGREFMGTALSIFPLTTYRSNPNNC